MLKVQYGRPTGSVDFEYTHTYMKTYIKKCIRVGEEHKVEAIEALIDPLCMCRQRFDVVRWQIRCNFL